MKKRLALPGVLAVAAVLVLGGCGPETSATPSPSGAVYEPAAPADSRPGGGNAELCAQIQAQKDVNARLNADGYADNYGSEYDSLSNAYCP